VKDNSTRTLPLPAVTVSAATGDAIASQILSPTPSQHRPPSQPHAPSHTPSQRCTTDLPQRERLRFYQGGSVNSTAIARCAESTSHRTACYRRASPIARRRHQSSVRARLGDDEFRTGTGRTGISAANKNAAAIATEIAAPQRIELLRCLRGCPRPTAGFIAGFTVARSKVRSRARPDAEVSYRTGARWLVPEPNPAKQMQ